MYHADCILAESAIQKGKAMIARVKARFTNGHIVPLERLDIEEGAERVKIGGLNCD